MPAGATPEGNIKIALRFPKTMKKAFPKYAFILLLGVLVMIDSCKTRSAKTAKSNPTVSKDKKSPVKTESEDVYPYRPARTQKMDLIHTRLDVSFDWEKQYLYGKAYLVLKPWFYPQNILELDAKGMDIHKVELEKKSVDKKGSAFISLRFKYDNKILLIYLDRTYSRTDTISVLIDYTAKPNELEKGGSDAITSDIGLYFINPLGADPDKPRQIWTQGETEASSCWFPTIDSPNEKTSQEMFITVDSSFSVLSNGKLISVKLNPDGTKTWNWQQKLPHAPYLFMMAIGKYAIIKDQWRNLEVNYYVEPQYSPFAKNIFGATPEMLEFFSKKLNYAYPWDKYSQVVVRDYVSGAMENTSATIFMEALQQDDRALMDDHWESIIAHELFHHWFGDLVTCESWSNLPLNESFATYSEYLWAEFRHGIDEADRHAENELAEYMEEAKSKQVPLIRYHYKHREDMFDRHSYNKGGLILHMLRNYVGDEAFFESLSLYLKRNQFKPAEIHHLRLAFEEVTGEDLNWFFNQWFFTPGHPVLSVTHVYTGGNLSLTVKQLQDTVKSSVYRLPVKVDVWVNGIKTTHNILIDKKEQTFNIPSPAQPNLVVFDSDFQLLASVMHEKNIDEWVEQFKNYNRYIGRKIALSEILNPFRNLKKDDILSEKIKPGQRINLAEDSLSVNVIHSALKDPFWAIRMTALNQFSIFPLIQNPKLLREVEILAMTDLKSKVRAKAIAILSDYDNKSYVPLYIQAMREKPYSVFGAGLGAYLKSGDKTLNINLEDIEKIENINVIMPLAEYYVTSGTKEKFSWFRKKVLKGSPRVVYNIIDWLVDYVKKVEPERLNEAKEILKNISENHKYEVIRIEASLALEKLDEKSEK